MSQHWSPQQVEALRLADAFTKSGRDIFRLFGYAGTGKTTLAKAIVKGRPRVAFVAPTNKAASVLRSKGIGSAQTIHSLIYALEVSPEARFESDVIRENLKVMPVHDPVRHVLAERLKELDKPHFILRAPKDFPFDLIVIDEASMVGKQTGADLMSMGAKLIVLGDPAQLPPIGGRSCFMEDEPDILLTEIHRQALESPVLRLAMHVRERGPNLLPWNDHHIHHCRNPGISTAAILAADQVIVGTHKNRHKVNAFLRDYAAPMPMPGEKLVCRRSGKIDGGDSDGYSLFSGTLWRVESCVEAGWLYEARIRPWDGSGDDEPAVHVRLSPYPFNNPDITPDKCDGSEHFEFGYALTVHDAQGSEWRNVVIIDDWIYSDRRQWLYTAITRASETVTIVKGWANP